MKNCRLLGAAVAAALLLLTSCLGDNNSTSSSNLIPVVVRFDMTTMKNMGDSYMGTLYAKDFEKYSENDCLVIGFTYDSKNQQSDKYYTVTLSGEPLTVPKGLSNRTMTDTTKLKTDEVPLLTSVESTYGSIFAYLNGYLFLPSVIAAPTDQKTNWELSYDPQAKAVEENGKHVYSLFLRATVRVKGEEKEKNIVSPNVFEMKSYFDNVNAIEKAENKESYYIKIYYIKSINEKNPEEFTWDVSQLIEMPVIKKE